MIAPLLGHNLVRLAYLDEAGISQGEPVLAVAGVLVHGDAQSIEVEKKLNAVKEKHIPQADRDNVFFHATDIYHGSGYFDRRKPEWSDKKTRWKVLTDLAGIIDSMNLPVVAGGYQKDLFGLGVVSNAMFAEMITEPAMKRRIIHGAAAIDCILWTDRWLAKFAPDENAMIIAEDNDYIKKVLKFVVRILRSPSQMVANGIPHSEVSALGLPLKRITDTPHFAAKEDAPALQLADLVAFTIGRGAKKKPVPNDCSDLVVRQLNWITTFGKAGISTEQSS
ncbi:MAG: hypothetical protein E7813_15320 [Bradyrhizobium sp.]|uniref:DUF3800 domain-containing protein n=1 Tax=Bradyrhizobium sp. TaxID=376 RepID=UPI0011F91555|nr:DUF3800 domain-containing protein [Bradyrhizobium sp.]THD65331.1 MAG: hypothetical protein E7813_15320 [Bradyrhizobium sp.]